MLQLTRVFHTKDVTLDLFPDGCWLPTTGDINAAFESLKSIGFEAEEGDDAIPTALEKKLTKVKTEGKKPASKGSNASAVASSSKGKANFKSKKRPRISDSDSDEDEEPVAKKKKKVTQQSSNAATIEIDSDDDE